jgi:hypothetical protein
MQSLRVVLALSLLALAAACASSPQSGGSGGAIDSGPAEVADASSAGLGDSGAEAAAPSVGDADVGPTTPTDAALDATGDAAVACSVAGLAGQCISTTDCAALGQTSTPGYCPGPAAIECCTATPSVASNPPIPAGYKLMDQSQVTPDMTTWAVAILNDPATYPMFSTTTKTFGTLTVLARVEWHPPDFQNSVVHRGVTLYVPV